MFAHLPVFALLVVGLFAPAYGQQQAGCQVDPFRGATLPQGAVAQMTVVNTGTRCAIENFGASGRTNPADSGSITTPPTHGSAEFVAPRAEYTPTAVFVGADEFAYAAFAKGDMNQQVRLKVRVNVVAHSQVPTTERYATPWTTCIPKPSAT